MSLYPAILTDSLTQVQEQLDIASEHEAVTAVQIDVIDGFFADNITVAPLDLVGMKFHHLQCDLHLMVDEPMDFVFEAAALKDHLPVRAVIAQIEHMSFQGSYLEEVKKQEWQAGVALDIFTPLEEIDPVCWSQADIIQLMGNELGGQGKELHSEIWSKLTDLRQLLEDFKSSAQIYVDVGVKRSNVAKLKKAGVSGFAVGSDIWLAPDPHQSIEELLKLVD